MPVLQVRVPGRNRRLWRVARPAFSHSPWTLLPHTWSRSVLAGRRAQIVMALLLDHLAVFDVKCVEHIKRLAVREAKLDLSRNRATIASLVTRGSKVSDCEQNGVEKSQGSLYVRGSQRFLRLQDLVACLASHPWRTELATCLSPSGHRSTPSHSVFADRRSSLLLPSSARSLAARGESSSRWGRGSRNAGS